MKKENKNIKIQVRVTPSEKEMLEKLSIADSEFSISRLVREAIKKEYVEYKDGIGMFKIK